MKINIYYTNLENLELDKISDKYKVSKSTIADKVLFYFTKYLLAEKKENIIEKLQTEYYYNEDANTKTCIKPKGQDNKENVIYGLYTKNKSRAYTNVIKIYLKKHIKNHLTEEHTKMFYQELNTSLQKIYEPNYNYNKFIRNMARYQNGAKQW